MSEQWCVAYLRFVCFSPSDEFPFWEVITSSVVTGLVTVVTIWVSIAGARKETQRALRANLKSEARARREREREVEAKALSDARRLRVSLAETMSRAVHLINSVRDLPTDDRARIGAEAEWSALRVSFDTAPPQGASIMYEYADLRVQHGMSAGGPPSVQAIKPLLDYVMRTTFAEKVSKAASHWAEHGRLDDKSEAELIELRTKREKVTAERDADLIRMVRVLESRARQQEEAGITTEDDSPFE